MVFSRYVEILDVHKRADIWNQECLMAQRFEKFWTLKALSLIEQKLSDKREGAWNIFS